MWKLLLPQGLSSLEERLTMAISNILSRIILKNRKGPASAASSGRKQEQQQQQEDDDTNVGVVIMNPSATQKLSVQDASNQIRTASALVEAAYATCIHYNPPEPPVSSSSASTTSLVEGPHWLCSSDLMCLLLRGYISNEKKKGDDTNESTTSSSFGAFDSINKRKTNFYDNDTDDADANTKRIGLLSTAMELDQGIPMADDLKFATSDIWIVHTGDHFMTMRRRKQQRNNDGGNNNHKANENEIVFELFDGLQPNGPIVNYYKVTGDVTLSSKAPDYHVDTFKKKRVGQLDDIVQANKTTTGDGGGGGSTTNYKEWTFEVVPAVHDPDVEGPIDDDPNEPIYDFKQLIIQSDSNNNCNDPTRPWRCATCYADRFKTMNFGLNDAGTTTCSGCGKSKVDAMWSLWLSYAELSPRMKRRARYMYAPKLELILSTLYPHADIIETTST